MDFGYPTYINQSIHTYIHSPFHTYIHNSIHAFNSPYIHSTIHAYIQQSIHTYIQLMHTFTSLYIHSTVHTNIHTFSQYIHSPVYTYIHQSIHTFTSPYVHHFHTHLKYLGMTSLEEFEAYWRSKSRALNWPCFDWKYWQTQKGFFSLFLRIVFSIISGDEKNVLEVQRTSTSSTSATISRTGLVKNNLDIVH